MRKKSHERPNRIIEINGTQWKLNRIVDKTAKNIHHIMGKCNKHIYNVNIDQNKIVMPEREHIALNNYFEKKQSPREQFQKVFETVKNVLSPGVRKELYTILYEADDEMFYISELLKCKKKKEKSQKQIKKECADTDFK